MNQSKNSKLVCSVCSSRRFCGEPDTLIPDSSDTFISFSLFVTLAGAWLSHSTMYVEVAMGILTQDFVIFEREIHLDKMRGKSTYLKYLDVDTMRGKVGQNDHTLYQLIYEPVERYDSAEQ